ncbi:MAG: histidine kinase dimerization/phospho-acceptor domain-containing protein [Bacteroidota bacterium]
MKDHIEREKLEKEIEISQNSLNFKQNFLASMSHEMRTPLIGVKGIAQLLYKTTLSEK